MNNSAAVAAALQRRNLRSSSKGRSYCNQEAGSDLPKPASNGAPAVPIKSSRTWSEHNDSKERNVTEAQKPLATSTVDNGGNRSMSKDRNRKASEQDQADAIEADVDVQPSADAIVADVDVQTSTCCELLARDCEAFGRDFVGNPLNILLVLLPPAIAGIYLEWNEKLVFSLNFLAILPLAGLLGNATEELAGTVGETLGGLLNATFGNAVEMILAVLALRRGLVDVVQGSLLGSILSNLLLVLGMCFFFGGLKYKTQFYNADGSRVQSSLLLLATLGMAIPTMAFIQISPEDMDEDSPSFTVDGTEMPMTALYVSRGCAIVLALLYGLYLFFQLVTHHDCFENEEDDDEGEKTSLSALFSTVVLLMVTLLVAICSEGIVNCVEALTVRMGFSRSFIGVVLLPIVGNAAEHMTAVSVAVKDKLNLSLGVALGSSTQIALFVVPFTVLVGWAMGVPMNLNFRPMSTGILLLTVLIVAGLTGDGESNWLEGVMLLAAYVIICITFWYVD